MNPLDHQIGGDHYKHCAIEPVQYWQANMLQGCESMVVKYVTRWRDKGGVEDLHKARHFIRFIQADSLYQRMLRKLCGARVHGAWWHNRITSLEYTRANKLDREEAGVVRHITNWNHTGSPADLRAAEKWMEELIDKASGEG